MKGKFLVAYIEVVDLSPQKQDADTEIQPQHKEDNGGKAPVSVGKVAEMVEVNGKNKGKQDPAQAGEYGSRQLEPYFQFFPGNYRIEGSKGEDQQSHCKDRSYIQDVPGKGGNDRHRIFKKILYGRAKYQKDQGHDADDQKYDRISGTDQPRRYVSPLFTGTPDAVQPPLHAEHSL